MTQQVTNFAPIEYKMRAAGLPQIFIDTFHFYYGQLAGGANGYITRADAGPVNAIPDYDDLGPRELAAGQDALERTIVLKLNGGLGTSMGMNGPKSLLVVKDGLSFLDIIVRQVQYLRRTTGVRLPLVFMNSFNTREATLAALTGHTGFTQEIPWDFVQHKEPKIWKADLAPVTWPADPEKNGRHRDTVISTLRSSPVACWSSCWRTATSTLL
ncbi:MAG: UTP--glucose-1-phosphate uridylyltransferase [Anaerolineales bacterium]|nr:UTP--glucose-1-phosphate uridylyltransferase [Anaerolineales bacterium]